VVIASQLGSLHRYPLTLVAGVLREPLLNFVVLVAVAKTARYFAVVAFTFGWI
jgi:membrane protein YqaA with SNARE-associated domain